MTFPRSAKGRVRIPGTMNKTEARYASHLELLKSAGQVLWYEFEGITLKLAADTRYTPDFMVLLANGDLQAHEIKGFWREDARVKIKVAAAKFPLQFIAITELPKKSGGGFEVETF